MLLIPAENGFNRTNLPWLTFALILLNILAFGILQTNDYQHYRDASRQYHQHDLLAIEKPVFEQYSERYRSTLHRRIQNETIGERELIDTILFDKRFTHYIKQQDLSAEWQQKRAQVNSQIEKTSTYQYSYYPSEPSWFTAFSHMFMHGDIFHLLSNMVFLLLFGYNLELVLGRGKMLLTYFISGLAAVAYFAYTTDDKFVPLVGASGAISGLMGGFAGFYGLKRIRYLFWIFVYFNYIKLPAILVLIYWLLNEWLQSSNNDGVAYMAHFGGLVAGFLTVLSIKLLSSKDNVNTSQPNDFIDSQAKSNLDDYASLSQSKIDQDIQARQQLVTKAKAAVKALNFDLAKDYYQQLISNEPNNASYYQALYNLEKENPKSNAYQELVISIIERINGNSSLEPLADSAIEDIKVHLGTFNSVPIDILFYYSKNCLKRKQPKLIRSIINYLVKQHSDYEELPNLLLHFAFAIEKAGDWDTKHKVLTFLEKHFASSFAGQEAKRELEANH